MNKRPRLLDLFCGQGGAGWGYHLAGFDVVGVDIRPQPLYPDGFHFVHGDALEYLQEYGHLFDLIHASPPCRAYTRARNGATVRYQHPELVEPTRQLLKSTGRPWVMENVPGAPLHNPVLLCGAMFGLRMYRHRLFEVHTPRARLRLMRHPRHRRPVARMGRKPTPGEYWSIAGNFSGVKEAGIAMEMPWANQDGLRQAIPPAYTRWIGCQLVPRSVV